MTATLPNPFLCALEAAMPAHSAAAPGLTDPPVAVADDFRFVLDEDAFMADLDPLPAFISAPSQEYLAARELYPVLKLLAGY